MKLNLLYRKSIICGSSHFPKQWVPSPPRPDKRKRAGAWAPLSCTLTAWHRPGLVECLNNSVGK